jgi:uncharacterized membrane protein YeiH
MQFGLGVFTALGALKAIAFNIPFIRSFNFRGIYCSRSVGLIRDILTHELPPTVLKTDLYATAALTGGCLSYLMIVFNFSTNITFLIVSLFVFSLRIFAIKFKLQLPKA